MQKKDPISEDVLRAKAAHYCASDEQCSASVRAKMIQWGASRQQIDAVLQWLVEQRYVDDSRYAMAYASSKIRYQHWGRRKVQFQMQGKGIGREAIDLALAQIDEEEYESLALAVAKTKMRSLKSDPKLGDKLIAFMLQRGFENDVTFSVVRSLVSKADD